MSYIEFSAKYWCWIVQIGTAEAATDPKAVIDGGVTTLVPTSTAESLNPAEKKVRGFQAESNSPSRGGHLHERFSALLHVSNKHHFFLQALENNRRIQAQNNAPPDFPAFVRNGYDIKIMADDYVVDDKGLIYKVIGCVHFLS